MSATATAATLARSDVEDVLALSPLQQGVFFHALLEPDRAPYVEQGLWSIIGALDVERFEQAWDLLVARHAVLRSVFRQARQQPVQIVLRPRPVELARHDLRNLAAAARQAAVRGFVEADLLRPIALHDGPLFRLALLRLEAEYHELLWTFSHVALDGWSGALLMDELGRIYAALCQGRSPEHDQAPPFRDFLAWLERQDRQAALAFWKEQLAGFDTPTPLPLPRQGAGGLRHGVCQLALDGRTSGRLRDLARRHRVTLSTVLQAAWGLLLGRHAERADVVFGLTLSGRPAGLPGVERMVGPFINTLPLRLRWQPGTRLGELLAGVQRRFADVNHFAYASLAEVQADSGLAGPRRLFDSVLNIAGSEGGHEFRLGPCTLRAATSHATAARTHYDLMADVATGERIHWALSFPLESYTRASVEALLARLERLLAGMTQDPDARVADLPLLPEDQRVAVLAQAQGGPTLERDGRRAHELVTEQAHARPEAPAASDARETLDYATLDARAGALAAALRVAGVGREQRVGILGTRSVGLLTGVLGSLRAGAAWVPLDPAYPDARLQAVLASAGLSAVLSSQALVARAQALLPGIPVIAWDAPRQASTLAEVAPIAGGPHDLAYVFYTSGSTGMPKGAMVDQAGMLNHLLAKVQALDLGPHSVVVQSASHCFDVSVWQMLAALLVGGRVVIYDEETLLDPLGLLGALERDAASVFETVPSLLDMLLQAWPPEAQQRLRLRHLLCTGEALPAPLARRWLARFPEIALVNAYGPTECADDVTHHVFERAPAADARSVPLGRPLPGLHVLVLDEALEPLPAGAVGQIAVGGIGVGRGYLDDPRRTAQVFVPDPFASTAGARLYLTGDRGRCNAAGELEYLGRRDGQVKVRGQRIELGDLEAALERHPAVRRAIADLRRDHAGQARLVAWWLGDAVDSGLLRRFLAEQLPGALVPAALQRLDELPVNRNGKVERAALPDPPDDALASAGQAAPRTPVECALAAIWAEVLGLEDVGREADFFERGGHSLKTLQLRARIQQRLGVELPLRALFDQPSLAGQAQLIEARLAGASSPRTPGIARLAGHGPFELSHAQRRLWFLQQLEPDSSAYNLAAHVRLDGPLDAGAFERAFSGLVARHAALRTRFEVVAGRAVQHIDESFQPVLQREDLSQLPEVARAARSEATLNATLLAPFDLSQPPVRALLLRLEPERHVFVLVQHHLLTDGTSGGVLARDFLRLYAAAQAGDQATLPAPRLRHVDHAGWQNERLAAGALAASEAFWRQQLADERPGLEWPWDTSGQAAGVIEEAVLPKALVASLEQAGQACEATRFMVELGLVKAFLVRLLEVSDLRVGTPVAGREHAETEDLVGPLANTLVVRSRLTGQQAFADVLRHVRQACLEAYAHQEYPFDLLVERLHPQRRAGELPLVDLLFTTEAVAEPVHLGALVLTPAAPDAGPAARVARHSGAALTVACVEQRDGAWRFVFHHPAGAELAPAFAAFAADLAERLELPLDALAVLAPATRARLEAWACGPAPGAGTDDLLARIAAHGASRPTAPALVEGATTWTYAQLVAQADGVARQLREAGVTIESVVGVCLPRGARFVLAALGTLASGAAYLPLDPDLPDERLAALVADARACCVLGDAQTARRLGPHVRVLDSDVPAATIPVRWPRPDPRQLAYVVYTSGSTGQPKGVAVEHRGLAGLVAWHLRAYALGPGEHSTHLAATSFDAAVWEIWPSLAAGACLHVVDDETRVRPTALRDFLVQHAIDVAFVPTPLVPALLDVSWPSDTRLRALLTGGDRLSVAPAPTLPFRVVNHYGPTEASVVTTAGSVPAASGADASAAPSIGQPIDGTSARVLDRQGRLLPPGFAGELGIGGMGLARGYLGRPAATADAFRPDPHGIPGSRVYGSGDQVRLRADGQLDFLGRRDAQLKLHGRRIEPGEIEGALANCPGVREALVVVRTGARGEPLLVAYLLAQPGVATGALSAVTLRALLAVRLPAWMVPAAFVVLAAWPLTRHGKIDRAALPTPSSSEQDRDAGAQPDAPLELALADIWARVLGAPPAHLDEDFHAAGGHSMAAVALLAAAEHLAGGRLPLRTFLVQPTLRGLANLVRSAGDAKVAAYEAERPGGARLLHLASGPADVRPLVLLPPQVGSAWAYAGLARQLDQAITVLAFEAPGLQGDGAPSEDIEALARDCAERLRAAQPRGPYRLAGWSFGGLLAFELARQLEAAGERVECVVALDTTPAAWRRAQTAPDVTGLGDVQAALVQLGVRFEDVAALDDEGALARLTDIYARALPGDMPPGPEQVRRAAVVGLAHARALQRYAPHGRLAADIHVLRCEGSAAGDPASWRALSTGALYVHALPGDHDTCLAPAHVAEVARTLRGLLERPVAGTPPASPAEQAVLPAHRVALPGCDWSLWRTACLRGAGFPAQLALRLGAPEALRLADGLHATPTPSAAQQAEFASVFAAEERAARAVLRELAADPRLREAVLWQNPHALHTGLDSLLRKTLDQTDKKTRQKERLLASYVQRYCMKNDSIGFFGPVGWVQVRDNGPALVSHPGRDLLACREVYFEAWGIDRLAQTLEQRLGLRSELAPRLMPYVRLEGRALYVSQRPPVLLGEHEARLLAACDGTQAAHALASEATCLGHWATAAEVLARLEDWRRRGLLHWTLVGPLALHPQIGLRQRLATVRDDHARAEALASVDALDTARQAVAAAAGDVVRLGAALRDLDATFTRLTGASAVRAAGEVYASRTLVYEDARRDAQVDLGPEFLERLGPPLGLVLQSARWCSHEIGRRFRDQLTAAHAALAQGGTQAVSLGACIARVPGLRGMVDQASPFDEVVPELQRRWATLLSLPSDQQRLELRTADLAAGAERLFAAPGAGWDWARYVSPDVLLAATDAAAVARGDYRIVLGEVHLGHSLLISVFLAQHPDPPAFARWLEADHPEPYVLPVVPRDSFGQRLNMSAAAPRDWHYEYGTNVSHDPVERRLRLADLLIESDARGGLRVRPRGAAGPCFEALETLGFYLTMGNINRFSYLPALPHTPRVTVDGVVLARERWQVQADSLTFAQVADPAARFLTARAWARRLGLPRFVFVKTPVEKKPCYVDLGSPVYLELFAKLTRATVDEAGPTASIGLSEMLPEPHELWLQDADGARYTSEIRMVARDAREAAR